MCGIQTHTYNLTLITAIFVVNIIKTYQNKSVISQLCVHLDYRPQQLINISDFNLKESLLQVYN